MKKSVLTLKEAFRTGLVKVGDYIDYQPIPATCILKEEKTGLEEEQKFSTEMLKWRLDKFNERLILVAASATEQKLTLRTTIGYIKGVKAQNELCAKLYSNPLIEHEVVSITEEIQKSLSNCNVIRAVYWLASRFIYGKTINASFGVRYLGSDGRVNGYILRYASGYTIGPSYAVRPVVFLKSDIQITNFEHADGSEENPWEICGVNSIETEEKEKSSDSKVELMQLIQEADKAIEEGNESINKFKELLGRAKELLEKM